MSNTIFRFDPLPNYGVHPIYNTSGEVPVGYELFLTIPKPIGDYIVNGETIPVCHLDINAVGYNKLSWSTDYNALLKNKIQELHEQQLKIEIEGVENIKLFKTLVSALTIPYDLEGLSKMHYHDEYPVHIRRSSDVVFASYVKHVASTLKTLIHLKNINDDLSK